jgi:hypothetical protein
MREALKKHEAEKVKARQEQYLLNVHADSEQINKMLSSARSS